MEAGAAKWIWENSRASNGSLIVLLAIADEIGEGEFTEMKIADIARKSRLSDRAARMAVKDLEVLGELSVTPARGTSSRYALCTTPAKIAGPTPADIAGGAKSAGPRPRQKLPDPPEEPQVKATPANIADPHVFSSTGRSVVEVKDVPAKPSRRRDERPDVDRLCTHLADRVEGNGCKRPNVTQKWRDSARLLIDSDGRTEEQVHKAIDWCQDHEFWRANILSMPKLREKYDQLQQQARRKPGTQKPTTNDRVQQAIEAGKRLAAMRQGRS